MAPPLRAYGTHRAWRLPFTILIGMVRVIGRENGKAEPAVMLNVDMALGPVEAKELLVREAAQQIKPEVDCASTNEVQIFLAGGVPVNIELLEKDDEIYFSFNGEEWCPLQKKQRHHYYCDNHACS